MKQTTKKPNNMHETNQAARHHIISREILIKTHQQSPNEPTKQRTIYQSICTAHQPNKDNQPFTNPTQTETKQITIN
jgi:hypothetical protein